MSSSSVALLFTSSHLLRSPPASARLLMILSSLPGLSGWLLSSPHRQECFSITGSQATPVFLLLPAVGEMEVPRETSGLDLVREMGFGRPRLIFSVEEWRTLVLSSTGRTFVCIFDNSAMADIGSKDLKGSEAIGGAR